MKNPKKNNERILLLRDSSGVNIPSDFIIHYDLEKWGIDKKFKNLDPKSNEYWEDWQHILKYAECIANDGIKYTLHHDSGLWAVPSHYDWDTGECSFYSKEFLKKTFHGKNLFMEFNNNITTYIRKDNMKNGYYSADTLNGIQFYGEYMDMPDVDILSPKEYIASLNGLDEGEVIYTFFDESVEYWFDILVEEYKIHN